MNQTIWNRKSLAVLICSGGIRPRIKDRRNISNRAHNPKAAGSNPAPAIYASTRAFGDSGSPFLLPASGRSFSFHRDKGLNFPYLLNIFPNRPVGGKHPHAGHVENRLGDPLFSVFIDPAYLLLALDIWLIVSEDEVLVTVQKLIDQGLKRDPNHHAKKSREPIKSIASLSSLFSS